MKPLALCGLAFGVGCLALAVVAADGDRSEGAAQAPGSQARFVNSRSDTRPVASGLGRTIDAIVAGQSGPAWIGYSVAAIPGRHVACNGCDAGDCGTVYLEGRQGRTADSARPASEAPRSIAVLLRIERNAVHKIRVNSLECELDAGGLQVHWLTGAGGAESVEFLARYVGSRESLPPAPSFNSALSAIALHADVSATRALERFVAAGQPSDVRKRAAFWLGSTRGEPGFALLRRLAETDADDGFRKELPFPISVSNDPAAIDLLIRMARNDANGDVRRQAIFWLSQKAGEKVTGTLADAARNDPETAIKERAVFALSRLPNGEGVGKLIEVAQSNRDLAVRKRAMFWLGQSTDPRALDYLTRVLTGK